MSSFRKIILFLVSVKLAFVKLEPNSREIEPGLIDRISFHTKFLSFSDIMNFVTSDRVKDDPKGKILCMTFWCNYDIVMTSWIIELWCHDDLIWLSVKKCLIWCHNDEIDILKGGEVNKIWTERGKKCPVWEWHKKKCENCLSEDGCEGGAHLILLCYKMDWSSNFGSMLGSRHPHSL